MKNNFTLAEVLITLAIIGIVATMTIPALLNQINNQVKENKIKVVTSKIAKGASLLSIQNGIGPYYGEEKEGTQLFLNELAKHLKIIKICDNNNYRECISYDSEEK